MDHIGTRHFVAPIYRVSYDRMATCFNNRNADAVHAGVPIAGGCSVAQIASAAINILIANGVSRHSDSQHQDDGKNKRKNSLHRGPPFGFLGKREGAVGIDCAFFTIIG